MGKLGEGRKGGKRRLEDEKKREREGKGERGGEKKRRKDGPGPVMVSDTSALSYTFWEPKMCTTGQRVLLTITSPVPSFFRY